MNGQRDRQTDRPPEDIIPSQPAAGRGIKITQSQFQNLENTEKYFNEILTRIFL